MICSLQWQAIEKSEHLTARAIAGVQNTQDADDAPCLWLRGILPSGMLQKYIDGPTRTSVTLVQGLVAPPAMDAWPNGVYFTDGSGGD